MRKGGAILILFMLISMLLWMPVQAEEAEWKGVLSGFEFLPARQRLRTMFIRSSTVWSNTLSK